MELERNPLRQAEGRLIIKPLGQVIRGVAVVAKIDGTFKHHSPPVWLLLMGPGWQRPGQSPRHLRFSHDLAKAGLPLPKIVLLSNSLI